MNNLEVNCENAVKGTPEWYKQELSRCFSMVLHYPEVREILETVIRVQATIAPSLCEEGKEGSDE